MGQCDSKSRVVHVQPVTGDHETGQTTTRRLGHKRQPRLPVNQIIRPVLLLAAFIGNLDAGRYRKLGIFGLLLWLLNIILNFVYDGYEAYRIYGYPWVSVRLVEWSVCCVGTWVVVRRTLPWLQAGLQQLEEEDTYRKTLKKIGEGTKNLPYILLAFALATGALQYGIMRNDDADHVDFGQNVPAAAVVFFHILRFVSGVHVFYAIGLFWIVPVCVMLMAGYSMMEYQELMRSRLRKTSGSEVLTFREALLTFNKRVSFVRESSSACKSILAVLLGSTLVSLAVNAYVFLFVNRYLIYVVHALLPLALAAYPLRLASWVTQQYHWYLVVVVRAWVERPDDSSSDSDSEAELAPKKLSVAARRPRAKTASVAESKYLQAQSKQPHMTIHMPDLGATRVKTAQPDGRPDTEHLKSLLVSSARVVGRLQYNRKRAKFNFEKYISYLEKVSKDTGFSIFGIVVTWELASSLLFLVISLVALFVQESIFGNAKSTI